MDDEMILNMDSFDFSLIEDDNVSNAPTKEVVEKEEADWLNEEYDEEESGDEFEDEEEFEEEEDNADSIDLSSQFDEIDDEAEFNIGGETITKAEIADVVRTRAELKEAHEGISSYVNNLSEVEMRISTYLNASMTETETRLRQIDNMLQAPERLTPTEVQKALVAKRDLQARQTQLEANAAQVRAAEEERRQQLDLLKIRQTDSELKARVPGYRGIETLKEIAVWAQKEGIDESALRQSMSPALIKALMDAKTYREKVGGKKAIRENAQKRTSAPRSVSSKPKQRKVSTSSTSKSKAYDRAMNSGNTSAAFAFLED